jgi:pyruvate,orthophosphate dikinase
MLTRPLCVDEVDPSITKHNVGNKAYNLMCMSSMGLPVPEGFVIGIGEKGSMDEIISEFELYDIDMPVSVRSGAAVSMPGMMDTILNVGLTRDNIEFLFDDPVFGMDCYRRLIQTMSTAVFDIPAEIFLKIERAATEFYINDDLSMMSKIVKLYEDIFEDRVGFRFFDDPNEQLFRSVVAVQSSWNSQRAIDYRKAEGISDEGGTAVIVQRMVFGNKNEYSGTGVVFSHNPNTGKPGLYGDFLRMAQGEDIVSGYKVPVAIEAMKDDPKFRKNGKQLQTYMSKLLRRFKTIQDVEFTIDNGVLYILQARKAKCSPRASIRSALSLVNNGSMTLSEATDMVMNSLPTQNNASINIDNSKLSRLGFGIGVSDGEVAGFIAIGREAALQMKNENKPYIFCAELTSPDDTELMRTAIGVLTAMGGRLSHAAVLARSMGKPTVVGFDSMKVMDNHVIIDDEINIYNGSQIKIDGLTGAVYYVNE